MIIQLRIMLLIGINTSLIEYPIIPIIEKPRAHELAIFKNSKILIKTFFIGFGAFIQKSCAISNKLFRVLDQIINLF